MRLKRPASITLRLTLLFSLASTVVLLLLGYLIGGAVEQHFVEQDMAVLSGKLDLTRHALEKVRSENDLISIPQQLDDSLVGHQGLALVVVAPDGQKLFATSGAEFPQALLDKPVLADSLRPVFWKTAGNIPFRGLAALANTGIKGAPPAIIAVATDISHHEHFMSSFRITLWSFVVLAALLTGFLGWVAVRRGLYPLQAMRRKAEGITAQKLDDRLDVESVPVELVDLAETLNAMLSRLEDSFRRLSDFSSDLAHELRTPVSNLLTQTQVSLSRPRTPEDYRDVLVSNVEEFERLSRMIADMLFIAKADEGQIVPSREKMDLERVAEDLIDFYRLIADEKGVSLSSSGDAQMIGDPLMIRRAISNLLSNAIRHTQSGEYVSIAIEPADTGRVKIIVTNSGETIPAAHLPRLFDRFYRVDPSRHWQGTHSGLGLAIVKSIVEAHGGEVSIISTAGKTSFIMEIPRGD
ncbi:MAG: heavy metal sensor histidine kinase [Propionivibrio sp.]|uniref:Sensor protein n=1 Tax=Candidatus Propionivibrio dominans TaxID=2954373 RepID=A0A9D7FL83_9RHOO|nr:heavy metal sensor histidine kinase [Candidatus Propionivibrio dominans]MBL0165611.1 heavy metal sensor histidine kinase [Propionivibrio sp.]